MDIKSELSIMSVGLYKCSGDVYDRNSEIISSLSISGESFYWQYWDKAVSDCNIRFFKNDGEFYFENKDEVMDELQRLYTWAKNNTEGNDREKMIASIEYLMENLPAEFEKEPGIFYIF